MSLTTTLSAAMLTGILSLSPVAQEITSAQASTTGIGASVSDSTPSPSSTESTGGDNAKTDNDAETEFNTVKAVVSKTAKVALEEDEVNIIGVEWEGEGNPQPEIRYKKDDGSWSSWEAIAADDGGADPGTPDAENENLESTSEIVPITDSSEAQVRFADEDAKNVKNLEINTVSTEITETDKEVTKNAPADNEVKNLSAITGQATTAAATTSPDTESAQAVGWNANLGANIVTRKEWGANEKLVKCKADVASSAKGVIVHHTAGSNSYSKAQAPGIIRGYLTYHTKNRGWCDLGYNFLVDKYGTIYEGRKGSLDRAIVGAHASGFNTGTVGVSVLGTYTGSAPSTAARNSVSRVIAYNANKYGFNPTGKMTLKGGGGSSKYKSGSTVTFNAVSGHRDTGYTECPGLAFQRKLGSVASKAKSIQGDLKKPSPGYTIKGEIKKYYDKNGGSKAFGTPTGNQKTLKNPNGLVQSFTKGHIYYSKDAGAHYISKSTKIFSKWKSSKYEKGVLGFPTGKQLKLRKAGGGTYGVVQSFTGGSIVSSPKGTYIIQGDIATKWRSMGWGRSSLGVPTSDQKGGLKNKGTYQRFVGGTMYDSSKTKPFAVKKGTAIDKKWRSMGATSGSLGFPTSGELKLRKAGGGTYGVVQSFTGGSIVSSPKGTYLVKGDIGKKWKSMKWGRSELGVPTSDQKGGLKNKGTYQRFAGGTMYDSASTNPQSVKKGTAIDKKWRSMGATKSILGYPTSNEYKSGSTLKQDFQMGTIIYNTKTKKTTYVYAVNGGPLIINNPPKGGPFIINPSKG